MSRLQDVIVEYATRITTAMAEDGLLEYFKGHDIVLKDKGNAPIELPYIKTVVKAMEMAPNNTGDRVFDMTFKAYIYSKKTGDFLTKTGGAIYDFENFINAVFSDFDFNDLARDISTIKGTIVEETEEFIETEVEITIQTNEFSPGAL